MDVRYWPFEVLPPDKRNDRGNAIIAFLERALSSGFRPYSFGQENYGASAQSGRVGELIHRGAGRYWEILLQNGEEVESSIYVDGFDQAASAVFQWLSGDEASQISIKLQSSIVAAPGIRGW